MSLSPFALAFLLAQAPAPAPEAAPAAPVSEAAPEAAVVAPAPPVVEKPVDPWVGSVGLGLIFLTGNANSITGTANAQADKKWGEWSIGLRANGAYGQSQPDSASAPETTALRAAFLARGERGIIGLASLYLNGAVETDHVKSLEYRAGGEAGSGLTFVNYKIEDLEKMLLRLDVAFRYSHEANYTYFPLPVFGSYAQRDVVAPKLGLAFRYALTKDIKFSEEAEVVTNLLGSVRVLVNSNTKFSARLVSALSLTVSFLVSYDSIPAVGKKATDTALTVGFEAGF